MLERERPQSSSDLGLGFGLDESTFERWWYHALLAEDASEFSHLAGGTRDGARFVCALTQLTEVDRRRLSSDLITYAYIAAKNLPPEAVHTPAIRIEAQALYDDDAVQMLLERVRFRGASSGVHRIQNRAVAKIEEMFDRTEAGGEHELDAEEKRKTEAVALDASLRLITTYSRERLADQGRRDKRAFLAAMAAAQERNSRGGKLPTLEEAKIAIAQLREHLPPEEFAQLADALGPKALAQNTDKSAT